MRTPAAVRMGMFVLPWIASLMLVCVPVAPAQYDDPRTQPPGPARYAGVTLGHRTFSPQGTGAIEYSALTVGLILHQEPLELQFGYAAYTLGGGDRKSLSLATTVGFDISLQGSPRGGILIPLMITGDYTKAEATGLQSEDFNVGSVGLGTGLKVRAAGDAWELAVRGGIAAQYSFEGFGVGTGFSPLLLADATVVLRSIPLLDGVAGGYRFRMQRWDMHDDLFDYRSIEHALFLGVLF